MNMIKGIINEFVPSAEHPRQSALHLNSFSERINYLLHEQRRSKVWLAEQLNISKQNLNYLINHANKNKYINEIAELLNVHSQWLQRGEGPITDQKNKPYFAIPILPITLNQPNQPLKPLEENKLMVSSNHDPASFCICLYNHSMEPVIAQSSLLIFDPNKMIRDGDYACISLKKIDGILFRQYHQSSEGPLINTPSQQKKEKLDTDYIIHGVLTEIRTSFH